MNPTKRVLRSLQLALGESGMGFIHSYALEAALPTLSRWEAIAFSELLPEHFDEPEKWFPWSSVVRAADFDYYHFLNPRQARRMLRKLEFLDIIEVRETITPTGSDKLHRIRWEPLASRLTVAESQLMEDEEITDEELTSYQ